MAETVDNLSPQVSIDIAHADRLSREKLPASIIRVKGRPISTSRDFIESIPTETEKEFGLLTPSTYAMLPGSPELNGREGLYQRGVFIPSIDFEECAKQMQKEKIPKELPSPEKVMKLHEEGTGIHKNSNHVGKETKRYSKS